MSKKDKNNSSADVGAHCVIARGRGVVYIDDAFSGYFNTTDEIFKDTHVTELIDIAGLNIKNPIRDWWDIPPGYYAPTLNKSDKRKKTIPFRIDRIESVNNQSFTMISITDEAKDALKGEGRFAEAVGRLSEFMEKLGTFRLHVKGKDTFDDMADQLPSRNLIEDFRQFFNLSVDILIMADKSGRITKVNPSFRRLLGFRSEDVQGKLFTDLIHPDDRKKNGFKINNKIMAAPVPFQESRVVCKDGSIRWLEWKSRSFGNMTYIVASDITSHKIYQSELAMRESQLRDAQKMARMGYWNWKPGDDHVHFSSHLYDIFEVDRKDFNPTVDNVRNMVRKRDMMRLYHYIQIMMKDKEPTHFDFKITLRPNDERFVRCYGRCETDSRGKVTALYGLLQDITEEKNNRRELIRAKRDVESALHAKSRFLANMSHELRTPLNAIIGFSEVMKSELLGPVGSSQYRDYISGIHESGQHLLDIISDILDMSKMEAGKYEIVKEQISLSKSVRLAVHMMQSAADEAEIAIDVDVPDDLPNMYADRRGIMQILANLLSNSVKFTNAGGWITVTARIDNDVASICVEDTGIGIPKSMLVRVTKPFEQVAGALTRGHQGTGLGLAITKNLAELHGGTLRMDSEEGVGTKVTVTIPVKYPDGINDNKTAAKG